MSSVGIHPPKTPVTKGSNGVAKATLPNVCKMPGPPAPFVPSPLPNIAKSGTSPKDYSTSVKIEGNTVAIRGATFESMGDMASKGTGGGLISANTHGPAKFITPGSMTVKIEGKNVHLLGEPVLNNCGASGSPPNTGATMMGVGQGKAPKGAAKCGHPQIELEEKSHSDKAQEANRNVSSAKRDLGAANQQNAAAQSALASPPRGARMSSIRQAAKIAGQRLEAAKDYLKKQQRAAASARRENKVAHDEGGGKSYVIKCKVCGEELGDFDVVVPGKVKEVKSSAGGFSKAQFDKLKAFVETAQVLGPGMVMKVAVPPGVAAGLEASYPDLKGRTQEH